MKWFDKWFKKKCVEAWNSRNDIEAEVAPSIHGKNLATVRSSQSIDSPGMNFTVYRASGGHVIETRTYDRHKDRNNHGLHIITDDKDLGDEIGRIITYENLKI
jgi:hypothetical protein